MENKEEQRYLNLMAFVTAFDAAQKPQVYEEGTFDYNFLQGRLRRLAPLYGLNVSVAESTDANPETPSEPERVATRNCTLHFVNTIVYGGLLTELQSKPLPASLVFTDAEADAMLNREPSLDDILLALTRADLKLDKTINTISEADVPPSVEVATLDICTAQELVRSAMAALADRTD